MAIVVQDRDMELLKRLNKYGAIYLKDVYDIYRSKFADKGTKDTFKYKRLKMLENENFIVKKEGIYYLGVTGKEYLKNEGEQEGYKRVRNEQRKVLADIYNLAKDLNCFKEIITRSDLNGGAEYGDDKKGYLVRYLFKLVAKDDIEYFVYKIKSGSPMYTIKTIITDMQRIGNINAIIMYQGKDIREKYIKATTGRIAREILIPMSEHGLALLNMIGMGYLKDDVVFGEVKKAGMEVTCEGGRHYVDGLLAFNLTSCDYLAEKTMETFIRTFNSNSNYYIICVAFMKDYFDSTYPNAKTIAFDI